MPTASQFLPNSRQSLFNRATTVAFDTYAPLDGSKPPTNVIANHETKFYRPAKLQGLRVRVTSAPSTSAKVIVFLNGAATALEVSLTSGSSGWVEGTADVVRVAPGDRVCLKLDIISALSFAVSAITLTMTFLDS